MIFSEEHDNIAVHLAMGCKPDVWSLGCRSACNRKSILYFKHYWIYVEYISRFIDEAANLHTNDNVKQSLFCFPFLVFCILWAKKINKSKNKNSKSIGIEWTNSINRYLSEYISK